MASHLTKSAIFLAAIFAHCQLLPMNNAQAKAAALQLLNNFKNNALPFYDAQTSTLDQSKIQAYADARRALMEAQVMKGVRALRVFAVSGLRKDLYDAGIRRPERDTYESDFFKAAAAQ